MAAWLPAEVVEAVGRALGPVSSPGVRWTGPDRWHVTLSFLGTVGAGDVAEVVSGLHRLRAAAAPAVLGPVTGVLGRSVLVVPVAGLDALAAAVAGVVPPGPDAGRPFSGHLTLARARRGRAVPPALTGVPLAARWEVTEVVLVRSRPGPSGATYATVATRALGASAEGA